jgi:agmatine/peptidylarginine deiminase
MTPALLIVDGNEAMIAALKSLAVNYAILKSCDHPVDIWIRDWGPVARHYFRYNPSYARGTFTQADVARARRHLNRHLRFTPRDVPLVLEGGNLVHNGQVAIATEKVFADNPQFSRGEIERLILSIGFERVAFIPVEPDDEVAHADGIVKFLRPDLLLVNDYKGIAFRDYRQRLYATLKRAKIDAQIVPFPWFCTDEKIEDIWSAVGCYINFILTSRGIIFPTFSHPMDEQVAILLGQLTPLPKRSIEATALAKQGGVLNCMTLTFWNSTVLVPEK